jgi:hypothetical protein
MPILTTIPNGASKKDVRDTLNALLARTTALEALIAGGGGAPTPSPSLSLSSAVTQAEGNSGTTAFVYTLTLNRDGSTASHTANWSVAGSGANPAAAADFGGSFPSGSVTFAPGETTKTITLLVSGDTAVEPAESFTLTASGTGLNTVTATGTISNDDTPPAGPMTIATFGDSHMTEYFARSLAYACAQHYDAYVFLDPRRNFTPIDGGDTAVTAITPASARGGVYAQGGATPNHMVNAQLQLFLSDVAAGKRYEIGASDGAFYNMASLNAGIDADVQDAAAKLQQVIDAFFDPAGNNGSKFIVYGTFGIAPNRVAAWKSLWVGRAATSNGKIVYVDNASALAADPANTTGTVWSWRGGNFGNVGSATRDGTHLSQYGSILEAPLLAAALQQVQPATFPRTSLLSGGPFGPYDPVGAPLGDLLGPEAAMLGTNGYSNAGGGSFPGTVVGSAHSGAGSLNNKWSVIENAGAAIPGTAISIHSSGVRQQELTLSGNAPDGAYLDFFAIEAIPDFNAGDASRTYFAGIDVEYVNVTGAIPPTLRVQGQYGWVVGDTGAQHDRLPDGFSGIFRLRTSRPLELAGNNPTMGVWLPLRGPASGTIRIRNPFYRLREVA